MRESQYKLLLIIILVIGLMNNVKAYKVEVPNSTVHQYITNESQKVWPLIPYETKQRLAGSLQASNNDPIFSSGENIINGSSEEDWSTLPFLHFRQPDDPTIINGVAYYDNGMGPFKGSYRQALEYWTKELYAFDKNGGDVL